MRTENQTAFAETYTSAMLSAQRLRQSHAVVWDGFNFAVENARRRSQYYVCSVDEAHLKRALELPGAELDLGAAVFEEALVMSEYWVRLLQVAAHDPRINDHTEVWEITQHHARNFADAYAEAAIDALKSGMPHSVYYDEDGGRFRTEILDPRLAREDVALWIGSASVVRRCSDWGLVSDPASDAFSEPKIMRSIRDNLLATGAAKSMAVGLIRDDWK